MPYCHCGSSHPAWRCFVCVIEEEGGLLADVTAPASWAGALQTKHIVGEKVFICKVSTRDIGLAWIIAIPTTLPSFELDASSLVACSWARGYRNAALTSNRSYLGDGEGMGSQYLGMAPRNRPRGVLQLKMLVTIVRQTEIQHWRDWSRWEYSKTPCLHQRG